MVENNVALQQPLQSIGKVIVLEAEPGRDRSGILQQWLGEAEAGGANTWLLSTKSAQDGLWAGLNDWLNELVPKIQETAPHLIEKHSYELAMVLPSLRRQISVTNPNLTDTSLNEERVRNYPLDRAYRIVHGLIDLLDAWYEYTDGSPWAIACDYYDQGGFLVRRFFAELIRRRGQRLNLTLLFATAPGTSEATIIHLDRRYLTQNVSLQLPPEPQTPVSSAQMTQLAQELEQQIGRDMIEGEIHGARVISYWLQSDQPENALIWQARLLGIYNHQGFYEDGLIYCEAVASGLERLCADDNERRWNTIGNLFNCYATVGNVFKAYDIVKNEALLKIDTPRQLVRVYYLMAMMYARFLPERDFDKAEEYLHRSLSTLKETEMPSDEKHFLTAFDLNGLALVRHRQGYPSEAVELCQQAIKQLNAHLRLEQHQLHRSVLHYNIAQVYAAIGALEDAVTYFTDAIAADLNYSEYYNDRGNVYQRMGRLEDAVSDYHKAIELSPPYYEVWMNLAHCYHLIGMMTEAAHAYSVVLDLDPTQLAAFIGRAQALEALGQFDEALADYNAALELNSSQPFLLGNRATLHYELGQLPEALNDLNQAIALSPDNPELYQNRAIVLIALGQSDTAAQDLQTYLRLNPDAEDRAEVESNLFSLGKSGCVN